MTFTFDASALAGKSVVVFERLYDGEKLVALFNFAETEKTVAVDELGDYTDMLTGEPVDKSAVVLPPAGFVWMLAEL
jgi:amylosucrase